MDTRLLTLLDAFQSRGWTLTGAVDISSDWWFSDILMLTSVWKPVGKVMYLTLLTDPQITHEKNVWSIAISSDIPDGPHYKFIAQVTMNDMKRIDLSSFINNINKILLVDL